MLNNATSVVVFFAVLFSFSRAAPATESELVKDTRSQLQADPAATIDRLNDSLMVKLLEQKEYSAVEEFAVAGTLALPADTWRIEQLQKHRIRALLEENRPAEALRAAKALFNVCGLSFIKDELPILCECLAKAHSDDPGIVPRFKRQVLAGAQEDPAERQRLLAKFGGNSIMTSLEADPAPYSEALRHRASINDWRGLYGTGNLLLLSGRVKEAREIFTRVYTEAPAGEGRYASEAMAKLLKAEDGGLGRANEFVRSIRPKR
jgi:hypothetical protein